MTFVETAKFSNFQFPTSDWSTDRVETLRKLWGAGHSASYIAGELGGVSRSAVIGKVHRLQLEARRITVRMPEKNHNRPHKRVSFRAIFKPRPAIAPELLVGEPAPNPVYSVDALTRTDCRWPYGDPGTADFHFCGAQAVKSHSYCGPHHRLAYQPKR